MKVVLQKITLKHIWECFFPKKGQEYCYLGLAYYNPDVSLPVFIEFNQILIDFYKEVDKVARPKYCPKFILRLLKLFGNDNSIVRVRNRYLSNLFRKITKGIMITDVKEKFGTWRIYGSFTEKLWKLSEETCKKLDKL